MGFWHIFFLMLVAVPVVAIIAGTLVILSSLLRNDHGRPGRLNSDQTELLQEVYQGLEKMEQRIESLETLVLEDRTGPAADGPAEQGKEPDHGERTD